MDRNGGMAAAAVLIAILGISFAPRKGGEPTATGPGTQQQKASDGEVLRQKNSELQAACEEIGDRLNRFYSASLSYPDSCYTGTAKPSEEMHAPEALHFAIALLPNPVQTNLPLVFDRSIEAIQQAAQDENYEYDGSWFPWTDETAYERFGDEQTAEAWRSDLQRQPGVVAFRRTPRGDETAYDGGLIVFVVGEQPTGGIADEQFENAMAWIRKLGGGPEKQRLRILGPTFSGTLPSLARELQKTNAFASPSHGVFVYSGTANSNSSIDWFRSQLSQKQTNCLHADCFRFRTFLESDELMTDRFLEFLQQNGYHLQQVAILSEDETAFGSQSSPSGARVDSGKGSDADKETTRAEPTDQKARLAGLEALPVYLYYPRDIATLRSAYAQQSIFSAGKSQNAPSSTLRGDLGDAATSKHDTVRTYAGDLTPSAQEATLFSIVDVLKAKHVQFIVIRSTNSLDQLFLSEFLRRSYSSGRVVLDGADLLFRRGVQGEVLRGVMVLSTYPLLAWTQDQIHPVRRSDGGYATLTDTSPQRSYRVFGEDLGEGTYIAARALFPPVNDDTRAVSDYGAPDWAAASSPDSADVREPATWLSVVGHRQFWPIAVLNAYTLSHKNQPDILAGSQLYLLQPADLLKPQANSNGSNENAPVSQAGQGKGSDPAEKGHSFPPDTTALMIFCWALGLAHCYLCWTGCIIGAPHARAYFAPIPLAEQPALIFIGSLLLAALGSTFAGSTGLIGGFYSGHQFYFLWIAVGSMVVCGLGGFLANYSLPLLHIHRRRAAKRQSAARKQELARGAAAAGDASDNAYDAVVALSRPDDSQPGRETESVPIETSGGGDAGSASEMSNGDPAGGRLASAILYLRNRLARREISVWALGALWALLFLGLAEVRRQLNSRLTLANAIPSFWRNSHISNGVSGLLPQVLLLLGLYAWFWNNLRGLSLFGEDRPMLPEEATLPERFLAAENKPVLESQADRREKHKQGERGAPVFSMFSAEQAGVRTEAAARPLSWSYVVFFLAILGTTVLLCGLTLDGVFVETLGDRAFGVFIFFVMCIAIAIVLSDTLRLAVAWGRLRQLLVFLDRLRLRRTLARLKGLSWKSVLSISGNVLEERYRLISRQLESSRNLQTALAAWKPGNAADEAHKEVAMRELGHCEEAGLQFAVEYAAALRKPSREVVAALKENLRTYQRVIANTAGRILSNIILPAWQREEQSLILELEADGKTEEKEESLPPLSADAYVRAAEEFFVLPYLGFIQNILGAMRTVIIGVLLLFMATTLALSSYPFSPRPALGAIFLILFLMVGAVVVFVYTKMHRDATLSHITQTRPGELGFEFWSRIFSFGIGPLIGLLTTLFPSITDFVVSWLQPGTEMMK